MVRNLLSLSLGLLICGPFVFAQEAVPVSCLPQATSLQTYEVWTGERTKPKLYPLSTQKWDQIRATAAQAEIFYNQDKGGLEISLSFKDPEAMSLPYNLYAVMVTTDSGEVVWRDFTSSCRDPGYSFFPGGILQLDPILIKLRENESYRVMIWGRM